MSALPKMLLLDCPADRAAVLIESVRTQFEAVNVASLEQGLQQLHTHDVAGVLICGDKVAPLGVLMQSGGILEQLPDGCAVVDTDEKILWANAALKRLATTESGIEGESFFGAFRELRIIGLDFTPFNTALVTGVAARTTAKIGEQAYFELQVTPVFDRSSETPLLLIAMLRDVTTEVSERERLKAIYQAGMELGDLTPQEVLDMDLNERKELLKCKIIYFTKDLLKFETVEIRLRDEATNRLCPHLGYGLEPAAAERELFAEPTGNGVTGYVAATGNSYLCLDTRNDPLYLIGNATARSSLTVPITRHEKILGTLNVESSKENAFNEKDQEFLELFSREVAIALNTLELLVVQRNAAANEYNLRTLKRVAQPVDDVLIDASRLIERFIGMDPEASAALQRILKHTRQIKELIAEVGQEITPPGSLPVSDAPPPHPLLRGKRILVVDNDDSVREAARTLLGQFGCVIETTHCASEAFFNAKAAPYDLALVDIRLSDMTGFDCFQRLREILPELSIVLMTGFGYDPGHSIVKARQAGLKHALYKPFRLDLLLSTVEAALTPA